MIYQYRCPYCQTMYDIVQTASDVHEYVCPTCNFVCTRQWHIPQISVSDGGFFSATVGEYVKDHRDFENKLDRTRYMTRMDRHLQRDFGYNKPPEQEWVDKREAREARSREKADRDYEESQAWLEKRSETRT